VLDSGIHGHPHLLQQFFQLLLNALCDKIFADLRLEALCLGRLIRDNFLDRALNALIGIEQ
jgi:hypothetical protein